MLDKNGLPSLPHSAFSAFQVPGGIDPRTAAAHAAAAAVWDTRIQQHHQAAAVAAAAAAGISPATAAFAAAAAAAGGSAQLAGFPQHPHTPAPFGTDGVAASALLGLPVPPPSTVSVPNCTLSPNAYLSAALHGHLSPSHSLSRQHQDYISAAQRLGELHASAAAGLIDSTRTSSNLRASLRANRKRALSISPYSEIDIGSLIRYSPNSLHLLNASTSSSGSYTHLSTGALSPVLGLHHNLQQSAAQLHAHIQAAQFLRSANTSPFLSPQNSLVHNPASAVAALHQTAASVYFPLLPPPLPPQNSTASLPTCTSSSPSNFYTMGSEYGGGIKKEIKEASSDVVSSTIEDDDDTAVTSKASILSLDEGKIHFKSKITTSSGYKENQGRTYDKEVHDGSTRCRGNSNTCLATADAIGDIKEEPDFIETHCHWKGCDGEFETQERLVQHLNHDHICATKKSFICQWVGCSRNEKPFKAQYMLVVHIRRHTGEKPHRCTFENCNKAYSRLENLKTHLRSHTGEKPYNCEFPGCSKAFSNASDRAKHQNRTHSNEKPYACKAPGCSKRYTDPSSLRKHVKTVHGADFYANKRHKGMSYDEGGNGDELNCQPLTPRTPYSVATNKSELENSPVSLSPATAASSTFSPPVAYTSSGGNNGSFISSVNSGLPLSDNNVSTTNDTCPNNWDVCDMSELQQVPMMASITACDELDCGDMGQPGVLPITSGKRLQNKMMVPNNLVGTSGSSRSSSQGTLVNMVGEINKSIEKMSIGSIQKQPGISIPGQNQPCRNNVPNTVQATIIPHRTRRDSNWTTVSTEGYGSMKSSDQSMISRRCSDLSVISQTSNISNRAIVNSPWDLMSTSSSRRSSMGTNQGQQGGMDTQSTGFGISQKLNRLHRKAQAVEMLKSTEFSHNGKNLNCNAVTSPQQSNYVDCSQTRRASDPVRSVDRNYGIGGQLSRHRSYTQLNTVNQRQALHGQPMRDNFINYGNVTINGEINQGMYDSNARPMSIGPTTYANMNNVGMPSRMSMGQTYQGGTRSHQQLNQPIPSQQGMWTSNTVNHGLSGFSEHQNNLYAAPLVNSQQQMQQMHFQPCFMQSGSGNQHQQQASFNNGGICVNTPINQMPQQGGSMPHNWNQQINDQSWQHNWQPLNQNINLQQPCVGQQTSTSPLNNGSLPPQSAHCGIPTDDPNNYQRTFDYVQQCQSWNGVT